MNIAKLTQIALSVSVMLIVCSIGLKAAMHEASSRTRRQVGFIRPVLAMFVIMPVVALILAYTLSLPPALEIAFFALAVSPVPPVLPRKALAAGGSRSFMLKLFVTAAIASIVFIPLEVELTEMILHWPARISVGTIARIVVISIIAPLGAGLALRQLSAGFAERLSGPLSRLGTLLLIVSLLPIFFTHGSAAISLIGNGTLLAIAVFVTIGLVTGTLLGGPNASDRAVLSLSTASRHPGIAMAIAATNFPNEKLLIPAILLYLIVNALLSWVFLRWFLPKERDSVTGQQAA